MKPSYVLAEIPLDSTIKAFEPRGAAKDLWRYQGHEVIIEGPSETGKTLACLHKLDALAWKYPGMQGMIVRKHYTTIPPSTLQTFTMKVLGQQTSVRIIQNENLPRPKTPSVVPYGGTRPEQFNYPNGSTLWVCGMDNPQKALSQERDVIFVNQCEDLSLAEWETLTTRCTGRAGNVPYPQIMGDCNPSAPTHWILSRAKAGSCELLHSRHVDNPSLWNEEEQKWTPHGLRAMQVLEKLTGTRRARLLEGLWVIPEGAIYEQFDEKYNQIDPFPIPSHWPRIIGVDPKGAFIAALWLAYDPVNQVLHAYREYMEPFGLTTGDHADRILQLSANENIFGWYGGGPSERQERLDFGGWGLPLQAPLVTSVWSGIDRVQQLFKDRALFIHSNLVGLLSQLGTYRRAMDRNNMPTDTIEDKESYHLLDCLRYAIVGLLGPAEEEQTEYIYSPIRIGVNY